MTTIDIDDALAKRLHVEAEAAGLPLGEFVKRLLDAELYALDDAADVETFLRTGEAIPAEDVVNWLEAGGDASGQPFPVARRVR